MAKKNGNFQKAMKIILKKIEKKKDRSAILFAVSFKSPGKKITAKEKLKEKFQRK